MSRKDTLAAGAASATFHPQSPISDKQWDAIWMKDGEFLIKYGQTKEEFHESAMAR